MSIFAVQKICRGISKSQSGNLNKEALEKRESVCHSFPSTKFAGLFKQSKVANLDKEPSKGVKQCVIPCCS